MITKYLNNLMSVANTAWHRDTKYNTLKVALIANGGTLNKNRYKEYYLDDGEVKERYRPDVYPVTQYAV